MNDPHAVRQHMKDAKRTQVAQSAVDLAGFFTQLFESVRIGGGCPRRPVLVAPEGMSTGGGRQARQSICLQPDVPGFTTVTVGFVDLGTRIAELRTYGCLEAMHRQRFPNRPFDVDATSYQNFFASAQQVIESRGFAVRIQQNAPAVEREELGEVVEPGMSTGAVMGIATLFFVLGAAAGAAGMMVYLR